MHIRKQVAMFIETTANTQMPLFDNPADLMETCFRGRRKHELWAFARSAWINLRRIVLFQSKNAPEGTNGPQYGLLSAVLASLKAMSQTLEHLKLYFPGPDFRPAMIAAGLKY